MKTRNKKILGGMFILVLLLVIVASADFIKPKKAEIVPDKKQKEAYEGEIEVKCDGKIIFIPISEFDTNIDDDFEEALPNYCNESAKDIFDWNGNQYMEDENYPQCRSFNETTLGICVCGYQGMAYDESIGDCIPNEI